MDWLPQHHDFRNAVRAARTAPERDAQAACLIALANHRLGYVEILQLAQAVTELDDLAVAHLNPVRIAVLSSGTVEHLMPAVMVAGLRRGLRVAVHTCRFGQFRQELLDPASPLHAFRPDYVLLALAAREVRHGAPLDLTAPEAEVHLSRYVDELRQLWSLARERLGSTVIQQSFVDTAPAVFGSFDRFVPGSPARLVARLNEVTADAASEARVLWLDLDRPIARDGLETWFDRTRWLQAKIEIAPAAAALYGDLIIRLVAAQRGQSRKCLVLDLDDTLWGGTIGDDGVEGIVIGAGSARGEAHLELQHYARLLKARGVILAVCSKNDLALATAAFDQHPDMVLRREDFAVFAVNWADKAENLQRIAAQLNLGLDSLVFVDDNPAQRARIREALPTVAVPELPADPALYVRCLAAAGYFEAVAFTTEDRDRAGSYAADGNRADLLASAQTVDDYLRSLEMCLQAGAVRPVDMARTVQLIGKTNQFNTTGRRYTADEIDTLAADGGLALQFRLVDRFGDNGLVSVMVLERDHAQAGAFELGNWVMSCRVFGRQLEVEAMNFAVEQLRALGARVLYGRYVPTARNAVIADLFEQFGFQYETGTRAPASRWKLDIDTYRPVATRISRMECRT